MLWIMVLMGLVFIALLVLLGVVTLRESMKKMPKITAPLSVSEKILELISGAGLLIMLYITIQAWENIDNRKIDVIAGIVSTLIIYSIFVLFTKYPPYWNFHWEINEKNAHNQYMYLRALIITVQTIIIFAFVIVQWSVVYQQEISNWVVPALIIAIVLSQALIKIKARKSTANDKE